jgi:hypothetical protein
MKIEDPLPDFLTTLSIPSKEFKNDCAFMNLRQQRFMNFLRISFRTLSRIRNEVWTCEILKFEVYFLGLEVSNPCPALLIPLPAR